MVRDEPDNDRFVIDVDGAEAELVYRAGPDSLILIHTGVPEALEGHGLGGQLVRAAVAKARTEKLTVVPWCPFARRWLEQHPEETTDIRIDWDRRP